MTDDDLPVLLTAEEAADWFAIPAGTIRSWASRGKIVAVGHLLRHGRAVYVLAELAQLERDLRHARTVGDCLRDQDLQR